MDRIEVARLFVRLAERGSFSAAARDLRIKQSTASKWVAATERQLGVALVARTTRALHLTEAGRRFRDRAVEVLAAFDAMTDELSQAAPSPRGRVRLSAPVVFGRLFVVPVLAPFLRQHPEIEAEIVLNDRYVSLVEEGFDLAIRVGIPVDTTSKGRRLADSARYLVASPDYLAARPKLRTPLDLKNHECLIHGTDTSSAIWRFTGTGAAHRPIAVHGRVAANNSEVALELARAGLGIALLADWLVTLDLESGRLVRVLRRHLAPSAAVYALTPPGRYTAAPVRALLAYMSTALPQAMQRR